MIFTRRDFLLGSLAAAGACATLPWLPGCQSGPTYSGPPEIPGLTILPRTRWTSSWVPLRHEPPPLGQVKHITIHHEGWTAVDFDDEARTIARLENIRRFHTAEPLPQGASDLSNAGGRGWDDIGYHFIVDRAGRLWEGRALKYQGAHVKHCNENNLGILCLGNFDKQETTAVQWAALSHTMGVFKQHFGVANEEVFTHQEWRKRCPTTNTDCPGTHLQAQMVQFRGMPA